MLGIRTKAGLIAAALCGFSHVTWADGVTINFPVEWESSNFVWGSAPTGVDAFAVMHFGQEMLLAFDDSQIQLTGSGLGNILGGKLLDGGYIMAAVTLPITSSTGNSDVPVIQSSTLGSGVTMSRPNGNTLTLSDFVIDTQTQQIHAQVFSNNGIGSIASLPLWHAQTVQTNLDNITPQGHNVEARDYTVRMTGLTWSDASRAVLTQALGLDPLAQNTWFSAQDAGSMLLHVRVLGTPEAFTPAIPEPSTYALMGLGLVGIGFATRRRQTH